MLIKGLINMVNRAFEGVFGYQVQLIVGTCILRMLPDWKQLNAYARKRSQQDAREKLLTEDRVVQSTRFVKPDAWYGQRRPCA